MHNINDNYVFMNMLFKFLNNLFNNLNKAQKNEADIQLIKFFKSEYGASWKLELDKHLLKNEDFNNQKAA